MPDVWIVMAWGNNYPEEPLAGFTKHSEAIGYAYKEACREAEEAGESLADFWDEHREPICGRYMRACGSEGYCVHRIPLDPKTEPST